MFDRTSFGESGHRFVRGSDSDRLKFLKGYRDKLDSSLFGLFYFSKDEVPFTNFVEWAFALAEVKDPDKARNFLYFGFQPMYDLLIPDNSNLDGQRPQILRALDEVVSTGRKYLAGYYTGQQDLGLVNALGLRLAPVMRSSPAPFKLKNRNVDRNGISAADICTFLKAYTNHVLQGNMAMPDYVVGCACGSSEIVMPLAEISKIPLGFIRRSWRRGDTNPRVIDEHQRILAKELNGKKVACVEDYVCSGESLKRVMQMVKKFGASDVIGLSVNESENTQLKKTFETRKFHTFSL